MTIIKRRFTSAAAIPPNYQRKYIDIWVEQTPDMTDKDVFAEAQRLLVEEQNRIRAEYGNSR